MAQARSPRYNMNSDANSIRGSVYDVFLELGALDANSRVAAWIFDDLGCALPNPESESENAARGVRFADTGTIAEIQSVRLGDSAGVNDQVETPERSRPASRSFGLNHMFTSRRAHRSRSRSNTKSTLSGSSGASSPNGDGYETDEGYVSSSPTNSPSKRKSKSRVRAAFGLPPIVTKAGLEPSALNKPLPTLPSIQERPAPTRSASSPAVTVAKAKSLFRKRAKSPPPSLSPEPRASGDSMQQWHEVTALTPRVFNPSVGNGEAQAPSPVAISGPAPLSAFRQPTNPSASEDNGAAAPPSNRLSFALPTSVFRSLSLTKRRITSVRARKARPQSLDLGEENEARLASSLPASPFILVTENPGAGAITPGWQPSTPFVFVAPIENPTPLDTPRARRFSEVTSMTAPMGLYPLSISRTLRRSVVFDKTPMEPAFPSPRLRPSSSYSSLQSSLALAQVASAASPYGLYNQPIPGIRRGVESPFPTRPILPQPLSTGQAEESRLATIQRYREFSEQLVEVTPYKRFTQELRT